MYRVYYKENPEGLQISKDFDTIFLAWEFLEDKHSGYIVLLGKFKLGMKKE